MTPPPPQPTMASAGEEDRLSELSDDLLRRILYFVPFKEAASTSALSRRHGSLWRSTGAVNLAVHVADEPRGRYVYGYGFGYYHSHEKDKEEQEDFFSRRDAFVRAAEAALTAASCHVSRLTFRAEYDDEHAIDKFLHEDDEHGDPIHDVVAGVLSHQAARCVEELCVAAVRRRAGRFPLEISEVRNAISCPGVYTLCLAALPSETLRVLDLTGCAELTAPGAAALPRLATLRLTLCTVGPSDLQGVIDAAPELATVHLESVLFEKVHDSGDDGQPDAAWLRLRLPAATALVLALCGMSDIPRAVGNSNGNSAIEIDAPRLRSFAYVGNLRWFTLDSPAPDMARVDLHFLFPNARATHNGAAREPFWHFVRNFANAKALKLKVDCHLKSIAVAGADLLCAFPNVELLELEGMHKQGSNGAAVAIANLLRCCPAVRDLTLKLVTSRPKDPRNKMYGQYFLATKYREDFDKSVDRFTRRRSSKKTTMDYPDRSSSYDDDEIVSDIPGLSGRSFACLQSSLRRVALQFRLDNSNCFGVRLVKFFAENAMLLDELCIDSGVRRLHEHMNVDVQRWIARPNSSKIHLKHRDVTTSSWKFSRTPTESANSTPGLERRVSTGFVVLPLQR